MDRYWFTLPGLGCLAVMTNYLNESVSWFIVGDQYEEAKRREDILPLPSKYCGEDDDRKESAGHTTGPSHGEGPSKTSSDGPHGSEPSGILTRTNALPPGAHSVKDVDLKEHIKTLRPKYKTEDGLSAEALQEMNTPKIGDGVCVAVVEKKRTYLERRREGFKQERMQCKEKQRIENRKKTFTLRLPGDACPLIGMSLRVDDSLHTVVVDHVYHDSPAEKYGFQSLDEIVSFGDKEISIKKDLELAHKVLSGRLSEALVSRYIRSASTIPSSERSTDLHERWTSWTRKSYDAAPASHKGADNRMLVQYRRLEVGTESTGMKLTDPNARASTSSKATARMFQVEVRIEDCKREGGVVDLARRKEDLFRGQAHEYGMVYVQRIRQEDDTLRLEPGDIVAGIGGEKVGQIDEGTGTDGYDVIAQIDRARRGTRKKGASLSFSSRRRGDSLTGRLDGPCGSDASTHKAPPARERSASSVANAVEKKVKDYPTEEALRLEGSLVFSVIRRELGSAYDRVKLKIPYHMLRRLAVMICDYDIPIDDTPPPGQRDLHRKLTVKTTDKKVSHRGNSNRQAVISRIRQVTDFPPQAASHTPHC